MKIEEVRSTTVKSNSVACETALAMSLLDVKSSFPLSQSASPSKSMGIEMVIALNCLIDS